MAWPPARRWSALAARSCPCIVGAQEADGFDGYIQSGTCAAPTDDLRVKLDSDGDHDVEPYLAKTRRPATRPSSSATTGRPACPGFGFSAIYTDQQFSLVITDTETGDPVACGDILEPDADRFGEAGVAVVQLLPVGDSTVQGVAVIQRTQLRARARRDPDPGAHPAVDGRRGRRAGPSGGRVRRLHPGRDVRQSPSDRLRVQLKGRGDHDVRPYPRHSLTDRASR